MGTMLVCTVSLRYSVPSCLFCTLHLQHSVDEARNALSSCRGVWLGSIGQEPHLTLDALHLQKTSRSFQAPRTLNLTPLESRLSGRDRACFRIGGRPAPATRHPAPGIPAPALISVIRRLDPLK